MKKLKFTKHAEQKLSDRNINKTSIRIALEKPDELLIGENDMKIVHRAENNKILRVFFREDEYNYIIITAYLTSKEKYKVKT